MSPRTVQAACCTPEQLTGVGTCLWETAAIPPIASTVDFLACGTTLNSRVVSVVIFLFIYVLFQVFHRLAVVWTTAYLLLLLVLIIGRVCLIIIQLWGFKIWGSIDHLFERSKCCKSREFNLGRVYGTSSE